MTMSGRNERTVSSSRPSRSSVPIARFSASASLIWINVFTRAIPSGRRLSTVKERLLRMTWMKAGLLFQGRGPGSPLGCPPIHGGIICACAARMRGAAARVIGFQMNGFSTLMQSAPMSARYIVAD
jgi:hypothetical protein